MTGVPWPLSHARDGRAPLPAEGCRDRIDTAHPSRRVCLFRRHRLRCASSGGLDWQRRVPGAGGNRNGDRNGCAVGKRAGLSGNLSPSVTAPLLLIARLFCQRAAMIAAGDGGAFLMLGGSDILCRKGVGSISPAPLAGCCMKLNLAPPVTWRGRSFSVPLAGHDEIRRPRQRRRSR